MFVEEMSRNKYFFRGSNTTYLRPMFRSPPPRIIFNLHKYLNSKARLLVTETSHNATPMWRVMAPTLQIVQGSAQNIARQRLSKHVKTHARIEVRMFIARCWETSSALINSLAKNDVTCFLFGLRRDRFYAMIR
jgi:hypothetical protein